MAEDKDYLVKESSLTSIANAIRGKINNTAISLEYPNGFINSINDIETGGGDRLYIHSLASYLNEGIQVNGQYLYAKVAFMSESLVAGAEVTMYTYGDYILDTITGETSGQIIPFTTVQRGTYTFVMPNESVYCDLIYDD